MRSPGIDAAEGKEPDVVLFEQDKRYRDEYLGSLLESYRMAMSAIASLELKVREQDEAIAKLESERNGQNLLPDDMSLPKSKYFVWHDTTRGREYELIECRGLGVANAYGKGRYGIDFIAITQPVSFQAWHLGELGLDSEPVAAGSLEEAEAIALAAYGDSLVEVRAIQCQSKD
jgi:hypothetical protein